MAPLNPLDELQSKLGITWEQINAARNRSSTVRAELTKTLRAEDSDAACIVGYGSLARQEWTSGSDVDWTLLVDGQADPQHAETVNRVESTLTAGNHKHPGRTGTFASLSSSHDLVHKIGGAEDTNQNTTRRILLLLESIPLGRSDACDRVKRNILHRYILEDRGLRFGTTDFVPRFLLNDIARYWRTMAVDFAQKQRDRGGHGSGLRNAKLRLSRKLIFASGLLNCLRCQIAPDLDVVRSNRRSLDSAAQLVVHFEDRLKMTPLENLAKAVADFSASEEVARSLLGAYDAFLGVLNNDAKRTHLDDLDPGAFDGDAIFGEVLDLSHDFQKGLDGLFFASDAMLTRLTQKYGVF